VTAPEEPAGAGQPAPQGGAPVGWPEPAPSGGGEVGWPGELTKDPLAPHRSQARGGPLRGGRSSS
jgi:hypothetical protein